jgi:hypothetical protein
MRDPSLARNPHWPSVSDLSCWGALLALLFITYLPCLVFRYAYADDYTYLYWANEDFWKSVQTFIPDGRPVYGYLLTLLYSHIGSVTGLALLRLFGLIGAECLGIFLFWFSVRNGWPRYGAFMLAAGILTLPAWVIYISWAVCCLWGFIWILPGAAATLLDDSWNRSSILGRAVRGSLSFILIVIALFTYQPAACAVWLFAAIYLLGQKRSFRLEIQFVLRLAICFFLACAAYYLVFKLEGVAGRRAALEPNLWSKLIWFFKEVVPRGFSFGWLNMHHTAYRVLELVITGLLLWILIHRKAFRLITTVVLLVSFLVLGFMSSIITDNRWPTFRSTVVVYAIIFAILAFVIVQLLAYFGSKRPSDTIVQRAVPGLIVVIMAALANFNASHYVVYPQTVELAMVTSQVRGTDFSKVQRVIVVPSTTEDSLTRQVFFDELGVPSTSKWWVWEPILKVVMKSIFPESYESLKQLPVTKDSPSDLAEDPATRIIDFRELQKMR